MNEHEGNSAVFLVADPRQRDGYRLIGWVDGGAAPHQLNGWPIVEVADDSYDEATFRMDIREFMLGFADGRRWVLPATAEDRVHADSIAGQQPTRWQYVWQKGGVQVYLEGYLVAQVFPHGARKHTELPYGPTEREDAR